jgi:GNAT superfamily N-acetyltransferase
MIELDSGAPSAVMQPVAGPEGTQFKFYSLRLREVGTIISACATRLSRKGTLSIVWIATGDAYKRRGFAKRMVEFIHEKAAKEGFTQIVVLLTHYS